MHFPHRGLLDCDGQCLNDSDGDGTCDELEPECPETSMETGSAAP